MSVDCLDRYHRSNSANPQNAAIAAVRASVVGKRRLKAAQKLRKMPLQEPLCSSRATSQAAAVEAPTVTTGMEQMVQAMLIIAISPTVLMKSLNGLS